MRSSVDCTDGRCVLYDSTSVLRQHPNNNSVVSRICHHVSSINEVIQCQTFAVNKSCIIKAYLLCQKTWRICRLLIWQQGSDRRSNSRLVCVCGPLRAVILGITSYVAVILSHCSVPWSAAPVVHSAIALYLDSMQQSACRPVQLVSSLMQIFGYVESSCNCFFLLNNVTFNHNMGGVVAQTRRPSDYSAS